MCACACGSVHFVKYNRCQRFIQKNMVLITSHFFRSFFCSLFFSSELFFIPFDFALWQTWAIILFGFMCKCCTRETALCLIERRCSRSCVDSNDLWRHFLCWATVIVQCEASLYIKYLSSQFTEPIVVLIFQFYRTFNYRTAKHECLIGRSMASLFCSLH